MSKILLEEQATPDTPATDKVAIYPKAGGGVYKKDDAGTEKRLVEQDGVLGTPASGNLSGCTGYPITIATDTIWDAAGDLVYGTGANTAAKLAAGAAGALVGMNAGQTAPEYKSVLVSADGEMTNPSQPVFSASPSIADVTGDGTVYSMNTAIYAEIIDQGGNFSNGVFTAPVTAPVLFCGILRLNGLAIANTELFFGLVTSNRTYSGIIRNNAFDTFGENGGQSFSIIADMDVNDTAYFTLQVIGGTKIVDISSDSKICGYLLN